MFASAQTIKTPDGESLFTINGNAIYSERSKIVTGFFDHNMIRNINAFKIGRIHNDSIYNYRNDLLAIYKNDTLFMHSGYINSIIKGNKIYTHNMILMGTFENIDPDRIKLLLFFNL